jgi:hypothetical protein
MCVESKYHNGIGHPFVGPGNMQEITPFKVNDGIVFNNTPDTIYISGAYARSMFRDTDYDMMYFLFSNTTKFAVIRRPAPKTAPEFKNKFIAPENREKKVIDISQSLLTGHAMQATGISNTGKVDMLARKLETICKIQGNPTDVNTLLLIAEYMEEAIQSMKKTSKDNKSLGAGGDDPLVALHETFYRAVDPRMKVREHELMRWDKSKTDSANMIRVVNLLINPAPTSPTIAYNIVWDKMLGINWTVKDSHSMDMKKFCSETYVKMVKPVLSSGQLAFTEEHVINMCVRVLSAHKELEYKARSIKDNTLRKKMYAWIKEYIRKMLKDGEPGFVETKVAGLSNTEWYYFAYMTCLVWCGDNTSFGVNANGVKIPKINCFGMAGKISLGGGCFWYTPEEYLIKLAKVWSPGNPYIKKAEDSILDLLMRREEKELKKLELSRNAEEEAAE